MSDLKCTGEVHPVADLFPMLADDELKDLAADIAERGLLMPIVLDGQGRILDGRNRFAACGIAGVEPSFVQYDGDDPDGYAVAVNVARRHMTKGQQALVVADALLESNNSGQVAEARRFGISQALLAQAVTIIKYAPDHKERVLDASVTFDKAYTTAKERKQERKDAADELSELRSEASDLAVEVTEERMSLEEAMRKLEERREDAERAGKVREIDKARALDGGSGPTFAQLVEDGSLDWDQALTLAEKWVRERKESLERDRARISRIIASWGVVQYVAADPDCQYTVDLMDSLDEKTYESFNEILRKGRKAVL